MINTLDSQPVQINWQLTVAFDRRNRLDLSNLTAVNDIDANNDMRNNIVVLTSVRKGSTYRPHHSARCLSIALANPELTFIMANCACCYLASINTPLVRAFVPLGRRRCRATTRRACAASTVSAPCRFSCSAPTAESPSTRLVLGMCVTRATRRVDFFFFFFPPQSAAQCCPK
jgi:hypothetical protein